MGRAKKVNKTEEENKQEIVLCKMFSGNYWEDENNLGYETINMFLPDDQALAIEPISYIYLPANGDYKLENHEITHVLLVRSVPDTDGKVVQIIGKAEVVERAGELLRNQQDGSSKISKCIGGKEFVGLLNIAKLFNPDIESNESDLQNITQKEIESRIAEIAKCYGKNTSQTPSASDYFELAVELGFKNAINRKLSEKELIEYRKDKDDEIIPGDAEKIDQDLQGKIKEKVEEEAEKKPWIKIANKNAPTEYNYWYARMKGWMDPTKLSDDDLISLVELEPDKFKNLKNDLKRKEDGSYKLEKKAKIAIKKYLRENDLYEENLLDSEYNFKYAANILGGEVLKSLLEGVMTKDEFCKLVAKQYNDHATKLREVYCSNEQKTVRNTMYGGLTYHQIFNGNKHYGVLNICASLKVKNLHLVDKTKRLYLTLGGYDGGENGILISKKPKEFFGLKKLSATSQTVYIPKSATETDVWDELCEKDCWVRSQPLSIENTPYLEDSYLTVSKHEYDELTYSNLFAYFFRKSSDFVKYFFEHVKDKKGDALIDNANLQDVSAETVQISDADWGSIGGKPTVNREERNIDIVLNDTQQVIVVENKIKSALNGAEIELEDTRNNKKVKCKDQLIRYYSYIEDKYQSQESKYYFIFAPDYNHIEQEEFGWVKDENGSRVQMKDKWKIVRYSMIFEGIRDYDIEKDENLNNPFDKNLFGEFLKALYVHTDSSANNYYRQMQKRLLRIKNKQGEKMRTKIYEELNGKLEHSLEELCIKDMDLCNGLRQYNLLFKTQTPETANNVIEEWAKENNVNLFTITENGYEVRNKSSYVHIDFMGQNYIAPTKEQVERLNQPNTVLFLKNLHKMKDKVYRRWLLDFINSGIVADESKEEGYTFVKNVLFAVATVGEMQGAELFELRTMDAKDAFMTVNLDE